MSNLLRLIDETIDYVNDYPSKLLSQIKITNASNSVDENKQILNLLKLSFPTDHSVSKLVQTFMQKNLLIDSIVAIDKDEVIGYISTTKVYYEYKEEKFEGLCLAPLGIHPQYQYNGIGTKLGQTLVDRYKDKDKCDYIYMTVLGHINYYPRFGFKRAYKYGLKCKWDCPKDAFMINIFDENKFVKPTDTNDDLCLVNHISAFDECDGK